MQWKTEIDAKFNLKTPAVADGTVYAGGVALHALDAETGEEAWTVEPEQPVTSPPTVADDMVVVGVGPRLHAYDPTDGSRVWRADESEPYQISVGQAVASGTIYVSTFGTDSAYDLATGERLYIQKTSASGAPVVAGEHVYTCGIGRMICRSRADGAVEWSISTSQESASGGVAPAVASGVAYFPLEKLYAIAD